MATPLRESTPPAAPARRRRIPRLIGLAIIGLTAIGAGLLYKYLWYARPVGRGPAGPAVPAERFDEDHGTWSDRHVLLLGIGDSITAGYGAPAGLGYFDRLVANPKNEVPDMEGKCLSKVLTNLVHRNLAIAGYTSIDCIEHQLPKLGMQEEDTFGIIVMTIGGNDIIHDYGRSPPKEGAMYGTTLPHAVPWIEN